MSALRQRSGQASRLAAVMIARRYGLRQLNDALADAEAMRIPNALVDPWQ